MSEPEKTKNKHAESKFPVPKRGTKAADSYFYSWRQINRLFSFVLHLVGHVDGAATTAYKVLVETESDAAKRAQMEADWAKRVSAADSLKANRQIFVEVIFVRHVENFLNYLAALLFEVFTQRPETLRSSETIEVARVLRHETIDALVRELAEKKVDALSYSSFADLCDFFQDRFKVALVSESDMKSVIEAIELRNISVHNRCVINQRFVTRTGSPPSAIGKKKDLYSNDLDRIIPLFAKIVKRLDRDICAKLKLKGVHFAKITH